MIHLVENIRECRFLSNFNMDQVTCFHRPLFIILESLRKNSVYMSLLLSDLRSDFWGSSFNETIMTISNLQLNWHARNSESFFDDIKSLINNNEYVILLTDLFYKDDSHFKLLKEHHLHYAILKGYDDATDEYIIIDEDYSKRYAYSSNMNEGVHYYEQRISRRELEAICCDIGYNKEVENQNTNVWKLSGRYYSYFTIEDMNKSMGELNISNVFSVIDRHLSELIAKAQDCEDYFINRVLAYGSNIDNYKGKVSLFPYPQEINPLIIRLNSYSIYKDVFKHILEQCEAKEILQRLLGDMNDTYQKIKGLFCKTLFSAKMEPCYKINSKYLKNIHVKEIEAFKFMQDILHNSTFDFGHGILVLRNNSGIRYEVHPSSGNNDKIKLLNFLEEDIVYVDIKPYCNNKGLSRLVSLSETADLTGEGSYFYSEDFPQGDVWKKDNAYYLSPLTNNGDDNISCSNQEIEIPFDSYKAIYLLGCSEWGSFSDKLIVKYDNNQSEEINIQFSDWVVAPQHEEVVFFEGLMAKRTQDGVDLSKTYKTHLFSYAYPLKENLKVKSLVVPDCANMHIFAITLITN